MENLLRSRKGPYYRDIELGKSGKSIIINWLRELSQQLLKDRERQNNWVMSWSKKESKFRWNRKN